MSVPVYQGVRRNRAEQAWMEMYGRVLSELKWAEKYPGFHIDSRLGDLEIFAYPLF